MDFLWHPCAFLTEQQDIIFLKLEAGIGGFGLGRQQNDSCIAAISGEMLPVVVTGELSAINVIHPRPL